MITLNKIPVPSTEEQDCNKGKTTWNNGRCVILNEGRCSIVFLFHEDSAVAADDGSEVVETRAFPVRVANPVTRDAVINAAEMEAYGLRSSMEVASFNASLARKHRLNPDDPEVVEHDAFISRVKQELDAVGLTKNRTVFCR